MKLILSLVIAAVLAGPSIAQDAEAAAVAPAPDSIVIEGSDVDLKQFLWEKRPLVVFADSPNDAQFVRQMELLMNELPALIERDVVILTDTDPSGNSALRDQLHPRGFMLVLIVKDGTIYLRKPLPYDVREISRTIDKLPMRAREIEDRRGLPD